MAHIELPEDIPGIRGLLNVNPAAAIPMKQLAEVLLRGDSTLTQIERELIATHVSRVNECEFCAKSHGSIVSYLAADDGALVDAVRADLIRAPLSPKMKLLLTIAEKVARNARLVEAEDVEAAKREGATDLEVHDTVLIAGAFCLYNKYVDGLGAIEWDSDEMYEKRARMTADEGYFSEMDYLDEMGRS